MSLARDIYTWNHRDHVRDAVDCDRRHIMLAYVVIHLFDDVAQGFPPNFSRNSTDALR